MNLVIGDTGVCMIIYAYYKGVIFNIKILRLAVEVRIVRFDGKANFDLSHESYDSYVD